jgi:hypothetical protein
MTEAEVEAVIGMPSGWYAGKRVIIGAPSFLLTAAEEPPRTVFSPTGWEVDGRLVKGWATSGGAIIVWFDRDRLVTDLLFREVW